MTGDIFSHRCGNSCCWGCSWNSCWCRSTGNRCGCCHWYGVLNRRRRTAVNANRFFPFGNFKFHNAGFFYKFDQFFNFTNVHNCFLKDSNFNRTFSLLKVRYGLSSKFRPRDYLKIIILAIKFCYFSSIFTKFRFSAR